MKETLQKPKILVADPLPETSLAKLREAAEVEVAFKLPKETLLQKIREFEGLVVRSETKVSKEVIESAAKLQVIARAGVGVDNIDVEAATRKGILILNSPEGNTLAAVEHTMALMLAIARKIPQADASTKKGNWERNRFIGTELFGKTLGILGVGRIGKEVASRAKAFHMRTIGYDPYVNETYLQELGVTLLPLEQVLEESDFVTIHLPLTQETQGFFNAERMARMKPGSFLINCSRGGIVDEKDLESALKNGRPAGAALDVFSTEPPGNLPLFSLNNLVATPHLGASTQEAQERVAFDVAEQLLDFFQGKPARSPVNIPSLTPEKLKFLEPYLFLAEKMGKLLSQFIENPITQAELTYQGNIANENPAILTNTAVKGLLEEQLGESVNFINAAILAKNRGIEVRESRSFYAPNYTNLISLKVKTEEEEHQLSGTVFENQESLIVKVDGYSVNLVPKGYKLFTWHFDKPGMVGKVGICLGDRDINIAEMQLGRDKIREKAVMVISVDEAVPPGVLKQIQELDGIEKARIVIL